MTNPGKSLLNITMLSTLGRLVFFAFVFLTSYVTSRALSKADFGAIQYIMLWVNIGWIVFNFGVPNILSRYFTQAVMFKSYAVIKQLIKIALIASGITTIISVLLLMGVNTHNEVGISSLMLILLIISSVGLFYLQVLVQGLLAYRAIFFTNLLATVTAFLFLVFTLPQLGAPAFIYSYIIVNGILSIGYLLVLIRGLKQLKSLTSDSDFQLPAKNSLIRTAVYFGGSAILAGLLWQRYELSILKYYVPYAELATYMIAFTVMALVIEPLKLIPSALIYYFASITNDAEKAAEKFHSFFKHFCWLVFFAGVFVFFHASQIVSILYTDKYADSAVLLQILLIGMIPGTCSYVVMNMHVGLGRSRFLVFQDAVGVITFTALLFLGNQYFGLVGAAWAKSIAVVLSVSLGLWYTSEKLKFQVPFYAVLGSLVLSVLLIWSSQSFLLGSFLSLTIKAIVLFVVYVGISLLLNLIERSLVQSIFSRIQQAILSLLR